MLKIQQWIVFFFLSVISATSFALPFNIYPAISLPTFVQTGQSVAAYYVVTNNANRTLNNNFVKYLPPNVAQVTADATIGNLCGATFNLAANGVPGDTCILELSVSGAVDGNDPDPHHHLFACLFGGVLCAGTNFPLNVFQAGLLTSIVVLPAAPSISAGQTQQFTATAVFSDGSSVDVTSLVTWASSNTAVATINPSGLASAASVGTATISATFLGLTGSTVLTVNYFAIVSGNYTTTGGVSYPILVQSSDGGVSWAYTVSSATTSVLPATSSAFTVNSASCANSLCLSVGNYNNGTTTSVYGFETLNTGTSYQVALSASTGTLPVDYTGGTLNGVSCSGTNCTAAGSYTGTGAAQFPLVMQTSNSGESFAAAVDSITPALPTDYSSAGSFSNSYCSSTICLASGNYTSTAPNQYAWLAQDVLTAGTWTYAVTSTLSTGLPDYSSTSNFNATACDATNCVAAGNYMTNAGSLAQAPLVAQATGTGTGWAVVVDSANYPSDFTAPPGNFNLTGASCATAACIAVGSYTGNPAGDAQTSPIIYQAAGGGAWNIAVSDVAGPTLPSNVSSSLTSASCSGTLCVAAGVYTDSSSGTVFPLIMVSTSSGAPGTWTIAVNPTAPTGLVSTTVGGTSCSGTVCTIAASYTTITNTEPLVIVTTNSGATFTYAVTAGSPTEPSDALNVFFTSAALSKLMKDLTHKDFNHQKQFKAMLTH